MTVDLGIKGPTKSTAGGEGGMPGVEGAAFTGGRPCSLLQFHLPRLEGALTPTGWGVVPWDGGGSGGSLVKVLLVGVVMV